MSYSGFTASQYMKIYSYINHMLPFPSLDVIHRYHATSPAKYPQNVHWVCLFHDLVLSLSQWSGGGQEVRCVVWGSWVKMPGSACVTDALALLQLKLQPHWFGCLILQHFLPDASQILDYNNLNLFPLQFPPLVLLDQTIWFNIPKISPFNPALAWTNPQTATHKIVPAPNRVLSMSHSHHRLTWGSHVSEWHNPWATGGLRCPAPIWTHSQIAALPLKLTLGFHPVQHRHSSGALVQPRHITTAAIRTFSGTAEKGDEQHRSTASRESRKQPLASTRLWKTGRKLHGKHRSLPTDP